MARVGGGAQTRRRYGVHARWVAQRVGRRPTEGVVARAGNRDDVQRGGAAFAEFILVGIGSGSHVGAVHADGDIGCGGAAALRVGDGDGIEL